MLITIITINYNHFEGLKKTMASVMGQKYGSIEYIVIDGGSSDGRCALKVLKVLRFEPKIAR